MAHPDYNSLPTSVTAPSGDTSLDALLSGTHWGGSPAGNGVDLTYSIPDLDSVWTDDYGDFLYNEPSGLVPLTEAQIEAVEAALQAWANVANIQFTEVSETASVVGELRIAGSTVLSSSSAAAWAYLPGDYAAAGDIWLDPNYAPNITPELGGFGFLTIMHEIGHALGLMHPFESQPPLPSSFDNLQYTIMSYDDSPLYLTTSYPISPMLLDILAIQYLYGPNMAYNTGDDVYEFSASTGSSSTSGSTNVLDTGNQSPDVISINDNGINTIGQNSISAPSQEISEVHVISASSDSPVVMTLWDAGGIDTLSAENQVLDAYLDLNDGSFSSIGPDYFGSPAQENIAIAFGAIFENATGGSGNDTLVGNELGNVLWGGGGIDLMTGGYGDDTYHVDNSFDIVNEAKKGAGGIDTVWAAVDYSLGKTLENLVLIDNAGSGTGNKLANTLIGSEHANTLNGDKGNDTLNGGLGNDTLIGGKGLDTFIFDSELGAGNIDILSSFSVKDDTIELNMAVFDDLSGSGTLAAAAFRTGSSAQDADDRIIYDSGSGALYYDADGAGGAAQVQFASLATGLALTSADFYAEPVFMV